MCDHSLRRTSSTSGSPRHHESKRQWFLSLAELRSKAAHRPHVKGQWKRLRTAAPVFSARLPKSAVSSLVAARTGADPRARLHPQNRHKHVLGTGCSCCEAAPQLSVAHALTCTSAWEHPAVEEAFSALLELITSLKLGRALVAPVIASAVDADALRVWLSQLGRVPVRVLVGRVGKGTVPLRLEHVYSKLRACAVSWASWIRAMHKIIEALWSVHELQADIAVAALQVPHDAVSDSSSSDAPSDADESELSDADSQGDLPPPVDPPDQLVAAPRGVWAAPPAHEAAVLMGLGDLVGRGALGGPAGNLRASESPDEARGNGEGPHQGRRGGKSGDSGEGKTDENGKIEEENQAHQGLAAAAGGRLEHGQQDLGVNAGVSGGVAVHARSLQDLRAPSILGSLWDLVGSLG